MSMRCLSLWRITAGDVSAQLAPRTDARHLKRPTVQALAV